MQKKKGISLIVLVITIIVMIILAGAIILALNNTGIVDNAEKARLKTEISELKETIEVKAILDNKGKKPRFGKLEQIIGRTDIYNEMLCMENGSLAYDPIKVSEKQAGWLEEMGIYPMKNMIPIYTAEQFGEIGSGEEIEIDGIKYTFNDDATYYLQNDIDFAGSEENLTPSTAKFSGLLDGQNYTLSNIYMVGTSDVALFVDNSGIIQNLRIKDSYAESTGNDKKVSILAAINNKTITNISATNITLVKAHTSGAIVARNNNLVESCSVGLTSGQNLRSETYGSLVGENVGEVIKCHTMEGAVAGLVGTNATKGKVQDCFNEYNIQCAIVRMHNRGVIVNCYTAGVLEGSINVAGITFENMETGKIINCYFSGEITCSNYGACAITVNNRGLIAGCYNKGIINSIVAMSGLCVGNHGEIVSCYNIGQIISKQTGISGIVGDSNSGNVIGCYNIQENGIISSGTVTNSYYYDATNDVMVDQDGVAITETLLKLLQDANDALKNDEDYETKKVTWELDETTGYPIIKY